MDYDTVELLAGAALACLPVIVLVLAGLWGLKNAGRRMPLYFIIGLLAALAYGRFAPQLAFIIFTPPLDPNFESGRSIDPRGQILVFGGMVGCAAALLTTTVFAVLSLIPQFRRTRAGLRDAARTGSAPAPRRAR